MGLGLGVVAVEEEESGMAPGNQTGSGCMEGSDGQKRIPKRGEGLHSVWASPAIAASKNHSSVLRPESQFREWHSGPSLIVPFLTGQGICDLGTWDYELPCSVAPSSCPGSILLGVV